MQSGARRKNTYKNHSNNCCGTMFDCERMLGQRWTKRTQLKTRFQRCTKWVNRWRCWDLWGTLINIVARYRINVIQTLATWNDSCIIRWTKLAWWWYPQPLRWQGQGKRATISKYLLAAWSIVQFLTYRVSAPKSGERIEADPNWMSYVFSGSAVSLTCLSHLCAGR